MEYQFSDRVRSLKPSAIREILKNSSDPSVIPLSAGNPAPDAFPYDAVSTRYLRVCPPSARTAAERPHRRAAVRRHRGLAPLRNHLMEYMGKKHQVGTENDDILITSGAQQVMDLLTKTLLNEGDTVLCEAPSFIGSLNTLPLLPGKAGGHPHGGGRHRHGEAGGGPGHPAQCEVPVHHPQLPEPLRHHHEPGEA